MSEPLYEMSARLGWNTHYGEIIFDPEMPYLTFSLTPVFPYCSNKLADRGIVWDLWRLLESLRKPGAHYILNAECGYPPDAYIEEAVLVSHPDGNTVVWELDLGGLQPALEDVVTGEEGFIRLVFARDEYESDIRAMLREVQAAGNRTLPVEALSADDQAFLAQHMPNLHEVPLARFEPTVHGDIDLEEFAALDADAEWSRAPLFAPGTLLEIGLFGSELLRIDGQVERAWIGHWFTRWEALAAFRYWMKPVSRRYALRFRGIEASGDGDANEFVLLPGQDSEACHRAGEAFAEALRRGLGEGETAPGVKVRYVRCDLPQVSGGRRASP